MEGRCVILSWLAIIREVPMLELAVFWKFWSGANKVRQWPLPMHLRTVIFHFCHLILEQKTVDSCVFLNIRSSIIRGWSWLHFRVFTSKFVCISAHLGLSVLGLLHYDCHSCPGIVCPPHRWHIWHSSCCSLSLCWWRCSVSPACKNGLLSFTSSPMPLRKSGRWAIASTFGFYTPLREASWALVMKIDRSRVRVR